MKRSVPSSSASAPTRLSSRAQRLVAAAAQVPTLSSPSSSQLSTAAASPAVSSLDLFADTRPVPLPDNIAPPTTFPHSANAAMLLPSTTSTAAPVPLPDSVAPPNANAFPQESNALLLSASSWETAPAAPSATTSHHVLSAPHASSTSSSSSSSSSSSFPPLTPPAAAAASYSSSSASSYRQLSPAASQIASSFSAARVQRKPLVPTTASTSASSPLSPLSRDSASTVPAFLTPLYELFCAVETVVALCSERKLPATFDRVATHVANVTEAQFTPQQLGQILHVMPNSYRFVLRAGDTAWGQRLILLFPTDATALAANGSAVSVPSTPPASPARGGGATGRLTLSPLRPTTAASAASATPLSPLRSATSTPGALEGARLRARREQFAKHLNAVALLLPLTATLADIPAVLLPQDAPSVTPATATTTTSCQNASSSSSSNNNNNPVVGVGSISNATTSSSQGTATENINPLSPLHGVPQSIIDAVRQREDASVRAHEQRKHAAELSTFERLPHVANIVRSIFTSERCKSLRRDELLSRLHTAMYPIAEEECARCLDALTKHLPEWLSLASVGSTVFVKCASSTKRWDELLALLHDRINSTRQALQQQTQQAPLQNVPSAN